MEKEIGRLDRFKRLAKTLTCPLCRTEQKNSLAELEIEEQKFDTIVKCWLNEPLNALEQAIEDN